MVPGFVKQSFHKIIFPLLRPNPHVLDLFSSILRPLLEMKYAQALQNYNSARFPRDLSTPPTIITSARSKGSPEHGARESFISLYDLANIDNTIPTCVLTPLDFVFIPNTEK